jgi:4-amino-4-deoxy-L-arabinose transferase-like glycosyltransferase
MIVSRQFAIRLSIFAAVLALVSVSMRWNSPHLLPWSVRAIGIAGIIFLTTRSRAPKAGDALTRALTVAERHPSLSVSVLALLSFAMTCSLSYWVLKPFPHIPDGFSYYFQAQIFAHGQLFANAPPLPHFFDFSWVAVHEDRWFSIFPPGWPLILAAGVKLGKPALVNPLLGMLCLIVIYHLANQLFGRRHGVLCALMCVLSPFFLFMSAEFMSHTAALLFTAVSTLCFLKAAKGRSGMAWFAGSGTAAALAFLVRPVDALAIWIVQIGYGLWTNRSHRMVVGSLLSAILLVFGMGAYATYNRILVGDWFAAPLLLVSPRNRMGFAPDIGYSWATFPTPGHNPWRAFLNFNFNAAVMSQDLFGWPITSLFFVLLLALFGRKDARHALCGAVCAASIVIYALYWYHGLVFGARFYFTLLPYLLMLTVEGIRQTPEIVARWVPSLAIPESANRRLLVFIALCFGFGWTIYVPKVSLIGPYPHQFGMNSSFYEYQRSAQLDNALVFVNVPTGLYYGPAFVANGIPLGAGRVIYALDRGDTENARLAALYPERSVHRFVYKREIPAPWVPWFVVVGRKVGLLSR